MYALNILLWNALCLFWKWQTRKPLTFQILHQTIDYFENISTCNNQLSKLFAYLRKSQMSVYHTPPTRANVDKVLRKLKDAFSKVRMLAFCSHTRWRKPENLGKNTDLGRATTTLPHADTGIRSLVAAVASECLKHCAIQAPNSL